jgi:hypothetical protein
MMIFQLDVVDNWPYKLPHKSVDVKIVSLCQSEKSIVIYKLQNGIDGV